MKIGEPQPRIRQPVQVGRLDLAAESADVGEAEIIRHDHQKVGPLHVLDNSHLLRARVTAVSATVRARAPDVGGPCEPAAVSSAHTG